MEEKIQINILVADDDEDDYMFLNSVFEKVCPEANLIWVKDGEEVTEYLFVKGASKPSLLLLDLNMPKKDGRQALKEIRERKEFDTMPIIAFTTSTAATDKKYVSQFKGTAFVTKPVGYSKYEDVVKSFILAARSGNKY